MNKVKVICMFNGCAETNVPLQAFLSIQDKDIEKSIIVWNESDRKEINCYGMEFKKRGLFYSIKKFINVLNKENPDVIHLHHSYSAFFGSIIAKFKGKKIVLTIHSDFRKYSFINKILFFSAMLFSDVIIANSKETKRRIPLFKSKTIVIYNGVEVDKIQKTKSIKNSGFNIITVSRLVSLKDIPCIIKAVALLKNMVANIRLQIIGDGPEREKLEKMVEELGLIDNVVFKGKLKREEVYKYLKKSDVYCSASKWEGFGNSIVEAIAAGLPVISSDIPVVKEILGDVGVYFKSGDYKDLAAKLEMLYKNEELRKTLSFKGIRRAENFSIKKNVQRHIMLYKKLKENDN